MTSYGKAMKHLKRASELLQFGVLSESDQELIERGDYPATPGLRDYHDFPNSAAQSREFDAEISSTAEKAYHNKREALHKEATLLQQKGEVEAALEKRKEMLKLMDAWNKKNNKRG